LPAAFVISEKFIKNQQSALILGDNLFHGSHFEQKLHNLDSVLGARVFAYAVENPSDFGIVSFDLNGHPVDIVEKPKSPSGNWAVPGLYFYDQTVVERVKQLKPSHRGELEITDLNNLYLAESLLEVVKIPKGTAWLDLGSPDGLLDAGNYVRTLQKRQGIPVGSPEEAAWRMGFITTNEFETNISMQSNPTYRALLLKVLETT
jgi:glucose-1-phosphate thymidylyltransferase